MSVMLVYGSTSTSHEPLSEIETAHDDTMPKASSPADSPTII